MWGGKKPTARSIKQVFQTFFEGLKNRTACQKGFFGLLSILADFFVVASSKVLNFQGVAGHPLFYYFRFHIDIL